MRALLLDLVYALRVLRKTPLFACTVAGTLSFGIAFSTNIFSVTNSVLLTAPPYPGADKLVVLQEWEQKQHSLQDLTASTFLFTKRNATTLKNAAALYPTETGVNLSGFGTPVYAKVLQVSAGFFRTLQVDPMLGRTFDELEDQNGARVVILSYKLWKHTPKMGRGWRINGEDYTAIGVMPESFRSYPEADLWLPLQLSPGNVDPGTNFRVIARIREEATAQQVSEELSALSRRHDLYSNQTNDGAILVAEPMQRFETKNVRQNLIFLLGAVSFVLLIACANITMLLLVRSLARTHEIAVRTALGSSRGRLIQVFFIENMILAVLGGLFGIILAKELLPILVALAPPDIARTAKVGLDWQVAGFACGLTVLTTLFFGVASAFRFSRHNVNALVSAMSMRATAGAPQTRAARLLLLAQTVLTSILLAGAMLFSRHLLSLQKIDPGFEVRQAWVVQVPLTGRAYETASGTCQILNGILAHLRALDFVEEASTVNALPLERGLNIPLHPADVPERTDSVEYRLISASYFKAMRIPVVRGRQFSGGDLQQTQPVAIVNESLARRWWPGEYAPGHQVTVDQSLGPRFADQPRLVVGVVADVHQASLEQPARPTIFIPITQVPDAIIGYANQHFLTSIIIRTKTAANNLEEIRKAVETADPDLSMVSFRPMSQVVANSMSRVRFITLLIGIFSAFALLITAIGLYGLLSYQINLRAREIAVRLSFGANRRDIVLLVVRQGIKLVGLGILLGLAGSFFLMRLSVSLIYNLREVKFGALASAGVVLLIVAILTCLVNVSRIASIEPVEILRNE